MWPVQRIICPFSRLNGTCTWLITVELYTLIVTVITVLRRLFTVRTFFTATVSAQRLSYLTSQHWIHDNWLLVGVIDGIFVCILESVVHSVMVSGVSWAV